MMNDENRAALGIGLAFLLVLSPVLAPPAGPAPLSAAGAAVLPVALAAGQPWMLQAMLLGPLVVLLLHFLIMATMRHVHAMWTARRRVASAVAKTAARLTRRLPVVR